MNYQKIIKNVLFYVRLIVNNAMKVAVRFVSLDFSLILLSNVLHVWSIANVVIPKTSVLPAKLDIL